MSNRLFSRVTFFESKKLPTWQVDQATPNGPLRTYGGTLGKAVGSATVLRHTVYGLSVAVVVLAGSNVWLLARQPQIEVVAIKLDERERILGTFTASTFNPSDKAIVSAIGEAMFKIRSITPDKTRMRQDWEWVQSIMSSAAYAEIRQQTEEEGDPILARPDEARLVQGMTGRMTYNEQKGEGTVSLTWKERDFSNGVGKPWRNMRGEMSFTAHQPQNKTQALANPLGLWVTHATYQED